MWDCPRLCAGLSVKIHFAGAELGVKGLDLQRASQLPPPSLQTPPVSVAKAVQSLISVEQKELGFTCLSLSWQIRSLRGGGAHVSCDDKLEGAGVSLCGDVYVEKWTERFWLCRNAWCLSYLLLCLILQPRLGVSALCTGRMGWGCLLAALTVAWPVGVSSKGTLWSVWLGLAKMVPWEL